MSRSVAPTTGSVAAAAGTTTPPERPGSCSSQASYLLPVALGAFGSPNSSSPTRAPPCWVPASQPPRRSGFGQIVLTLGPALEEIRAGVFLDDLDLALNPDYSTGCASSIRSALEVIDPRAEAMVLLLGDQPEVEPEAVRRLVVQAAHSPIAICRYEDGLGHPLWFQRRVFDELGSLHGDKAVWKLIESGLHPVLEVRSREPCRSTSILGRTTKNCSPSFPPVSAKPEPSVTEKP